VTLLDLDSARTPAPLLPAPSRERWQPLRAGLVDLFHYDYEEFHFRDGHLLLRGNNGTGKSKVLALLLPFLLDGDISPHRVEPDGDPAKRMEWNLLLGGRHPHPERTGYSWIEFGRIDEDGTPRFTTLGIGLRAVQGRPVATWFFVTSQRVGADLFLVSAGRSPLRKDGLVEAVGDRGIVVETAERYRRAVNETLFDLAPERYDALLTLLVQLRQPALSKRPDERRLSTALTESLPPLDPAVVADVADAFRSLEEEKAALLSLTEARDTAAGFLATYTHYARIAARRRAADTRTAQSRYEDTGRRLADARAQLAQAQEAEAAVVARLEELAGEQEQARRAEEVLRASPEMRSAQELHRLQAEAVRAGHRRDAAAQELTAAQAELSRREAAVASAGAELAAAQAELTAAMAAARDGAAASRLPAPELRTPEPDAATRPSVEQALRRQQEALAHLRRLVEAVAAADVAARDAQRGVEDAAGERDRAAEALVAAHDETGSAAGTLVTAARRALPTLVELRLTDPEGTLDRLQLWTETLHGESPLSGEVAAAARDSVEQLARLDSGLSARAQALSVERERLDEERRRLEAGQELGPPPSPTRDPAGRQGRTGGPLWQLVEFAAGLDDAAQAGLESALQAGGLLDAWVTPDGSLLDDDDAVLTAGPPVAAPLSAALRPAVGPTAPVAEAAVGAVLAGIGLGVGTGETWVAADGRFRVGVLEGRWAKRTAQYVGAGARAAARRARLAEIAGLLAGIEASLAELRRDRDVVRTRRAAVETDLRALPEDRPLRDAAAAEAGRVAALAEREERLAARLSTEQRARVEVTAAEQVRDRDAEVTGLPATAAGLQEVESALAGYRVALAALWPALARRDRAFAGTDAATADRETARALHDRRTTEVSSARRDAEGTAAARDALQATVGAAVAEVERRLREAQGRRVALTAEATRLGDERLELRDRVGSARGSAQELQDRLGGDTAVRSKAVEGLRGFAASGLLAVALPELESPAADTEWAPTPAVQLARTVESSLSDIDDGEPAWARATRVVQEQLAVLGEVLSRAGDALSPLPTDHGIVVTATWRGREVPVRSLAVGLDSELVDRERIVSAKERTLLESYLVSDVAARLQELIRSAESEVDGMNRELAERPTSTGMQLRFRWDARQDGPTGLPEARARLLRQQSDAWSEDDRAAVGEFLQQQIAEVRLRDPAATWTDQLREALDYRAWHAFRVERRQDGRWRPATGPASGGERVLAATIPLFAAASAHYASAGSPYAPRLVLLDEAFAGVDDDSRAKCLGLLATFDLDYVLTSEREWGCYPTVPGLAIAQLSRRDGIDAVLVTRWEWDGRVRRERPLELPPMTAPG
jgi:uncharacterized protein (TIGR02680 family)